MLSATRMAALVALLAVGGSLVLVVGPLAPDANAPGGPAAEAPGLEAAAWYGGTGGVQIIAKGKESTTEGVGYLNGQVSQMLPRLIEVSDPRMGGSQTFTQNAADYSGNSYPGFGPTWGTMRIEDDDGTWVGDVSGTWSGSGTWISGWLTGEGAYEGLVQLYRAEQVSNSNFSFSGAIIPADALPPELEIES